MRCRAESNTVSEQFSEVCSVVINTRLLASYGGGHAAATEAQTTQNPLGNFKGSRPAGEPRALPPLLRSDSVSSAEISRAERWFMLEADFPEAPGREPRQLWSQ